MTSRLLLKRVAFWLYMGSMTTLSLIPTDFLPPAVFSLWDKAQHALGFACLAGLGLLAYPKRSWRLALGLLLLGGAIELAQAATGWRHGDWLDLLANAMGLASGFAVFHLLTRRLRG